MSSVTPETPYGTDPTVGHLPPPHINIPEASAVRWSDSQRQTLIYDPETPAGPGGGSMQCVTRTCSERGI